MIMEPQDKPQNPDTQTSLITPGISLADSVTTTPATTPEMADFDPKTGQKPLSGMVLGLGFLGMAAVGALGLGVAFLPTVTPQAPAAQAAAAVVPNNYFNGVELSARSAYVYDAARDEELFAQNANMQLPLASITKVALVLAVAEVIEPDEIITISREAVERGGGGLTWGEEWRARDLIDFTLITSSNTGAEALAEAANARLAAKYPAATGNASVWRMNAIAQELGLDATYFVNPTGLDESTTQAGAAGSARDIAILFEYALRVNPELFAGTTRSDVPLSPLNYPERYAHNTNNALADIAGLRMGKTGTTDLAGGNLAIAFDAEENHPVIVVVLGATAEGRYIDIKTLIDAARREVTE